MEFQQNERKPVSILLTNADRSPFTDDHDIFYRIFPAGGGDAVYQVALTHAGSGRWTCTPEPDCAVGRYEYSAYDADADSTYVRGPCAVVKPGTGPA
jgi:hypothetical protein